MDLHPAGDLNFRFRLSTIRQNMPIHEHRRVDIFGANFVDNLRKGGARDGVTWPFGKVFYIRSFYFVFVYCTRCLVTSLTIWRQDPQPDKEP